MKAYRFILPEATDQEHRTFRRKLADSFGGYTATVGEGGWVDPDGQLVEERVVVYTVAVERGLPDLFRTATEEARRMEQKALYWEFPDGRVKIINLID